MINDEKIKRINELANKSKNTTLSEEELAEQKSLRKEYINGYRKNLLSQLDSIVVVDDKGNQRRLAPKEKLN